MNTFIGNGFYLFLYICIMMTVLAIFIIALGILACYGWVKLVMYLFWPKKKTANPYIEAHRQKMLNDQNYDDYIKWLDKNGGGIPFSKVETKEEKEADQAIKKLFR